LAGKASAVGSAGQTAGDDGIASEALVEGSVEEEAGLALQADAVR